MVMFVVYFSMAKPAQAKMIDNVLSVQESVTWPVDDSASSEDNEFSIDDSVPLSCEDCGNEDTDSDTFEIDMDEFIATMPHLNLLFYKASYDIEDMALSIPPFELGLEYPPNAFRV